MNKAQRRNGSLWLTQTVKSGSASGIRWYEVINLTGTPSHPPAVHLRPGRQPYRWMPSLAVDKQGNMAVGLQRLERLAQPRHPLRRTPVDRPAQHAGPVRDLPHRRHRRTRPRGNFNRWGDYSEMSVDPVDGCTFWFTGEYYITTGANWQTRIGSFKFPGCV